MWKFRTCRRHSETDLPFVPSSTSTDLTWCEYCSCLGLWTSQEPICSSFSSLTFFFNLIFDYPHAHERLSVCDYICYRLCYRLHNICVVFSHYIRFADLQWETYTHYHERGPDQTVAILEQNTYFRLSALFQLFVLPRTLTHVLLNLSNYVF